MRLSLILIFALGFWLTSSTACVRQDMGDGQRDSDFQYQTDQFADLRILRYRVPGFEGLPSQQKELLYYLSEAALSGRDIIWDQNYRHNLYVRRTLEAIVGSYSGDRQDKDWDNFMVYVKRVWFSNGIHHHYSTSKIEPGISPDYFAELVNGSDLDDFPLQNDETVDDLLTKLGPILFDPKVDGKRVNKDQGADQIKDSATNYYGEDLTQQEVERHYSAKVDRDDPRPVSHGLNSKLIKVSGEIREQVWKQGGMYSEAIEKIVHWLAKAAAIAETAEQKAALEKLIQYYETGDLKKFDEYSTLWLRDTGSDVDLINGFIEVYGDPLAFRGAFESVVFFRDLEATRRIDALSRNAQWFEDNSTTTKTHKKAEVTGISAKVITVVMEAGDASPSTPIGINLPNANWIRKEHGSKSVSLGNIVHAYEESAKDSGILDEFAFSQEEIQRARDHGTLSGHLRTDMHEVIGHASGQLEPGVGTPAQTLRSYASVLEEARADLVALYFIMDPKLVEIGVMPSLEVGRSGYDSYIRNGLMIQLARLKPGEKLEQAHMRNRHMVSSWVLEQGQADRVVEKKVRDGKTFYVVNDHLKLRELFGRLLREVQRIKSSGDYEAGKGLVEGYGIEVDPELHGEVLERYGKLGRAPYGGFINPRLIPVEDGDGNVVDVNIEYPEDFTEQMMYYGKNYSFLPTYN